MKKVVVPSILIIVSLLAIFYTINKNKKKNEADTAIVAEKNAAVMVRADVAEFREVQTTYTTNGVFAPKQEVQIAAETPGRIAQVLVKEGAIVTAGQTLAVIESDKQNVNLSNAQAVYNNAKAELTRFESAFATGGVTKQQLDQVKLQLENAKNNLRSAELTASDVYVKASFSGIINKRTAEPGAYVNPGSHLFEIVNISTLKLKTNVDEKNIGTLKQGQEVSISVPALPEKTWTGVITFMAPKADASLNFPVELEVRNDQGNELKAGMYGIAHFGNEQSNVFVVPRTAFVGNVSSNKIFVVKDGKAMLTNVISGRNFGEYVEIMSGLEKGDIVVISGQINLLNETPVEIIK